MKTRRARNIRSLREHSRPARSAGIDMAAQAAESLPATLEKAWENCTDLNKQVLETAGGKVKVLWLRGLTKADAVRAGVIECLAEIRSGPLTAQVVLTALTAVPTQIETQTNKVVQAIADGNAVVVIDGTEEVVIANVSQPPALNVERAQNEPSVAGPQEAFVGMIDTDIAMVRKRLRSAGLKAEGMHLGRRSRTDVAVLYFDGIANRDMLEEVRRRLQAVELDMVLSTNYIQEIIRDHRFSLFPTTEVTERPDKVAAGLAEGRFALLVDGSPQAFMAPTTFLTFLTVGEDYYQNFMVSTLMRGLRQAAFWTALLLPAVYIALLSYNEDLVPTPLLVNLAQQHAGIPQPTSVEMFLMVFAFEVLREAGIRLPKAIGQSVSIVGALVIGEASVNAGVVSSGAVIIVAVAGVASFTMPSVEVVNAIRILQFVFMLSATLFGIYGLVVCGICIVLHMVSLDSFGVPYLTPYAPINMQDMRDAFIRSPWWAVKRRPSQLKPEDAVRSSMARTPR